MSSHHDKTTKSLQLLIRSELLQRHKASGYGHIPLTTQQRENNLSIFRPLISPLISQISQLFGRASAQVKGTPQNAAKLKKFRNMTFPQPSSTVWCRCNKDRKKSHKWDFHFLQHYNKSRGLWLFRMSRVRQVDTNLLGSDSTYQRFRHAARGTNSEDFTARQRFYCFLVYSKSQPNVKREQIRSDIAHNQLSGFQSKGFGPSR